MTETAGVTIRPESVADYDAIREVNTLAFGRASEADIVDRIRVSGQFEPSLSLVAVRDGAILGHALFSYVQIEGEREWKACALGPIAVLPPHQRQGVGSALLYAGVAGATALGIAMIALIGHPEYYPRFGFRPASELGITCNIPAPNNVFMALAIDEAHIYPGRLVYPPAFFG